MYHPMTGGFISTKGNKSKIGGVGGNSPTNPIGRKSTVFFDHSRDGEPRGDNLFAIRLLGQTMYAEMVKDTIKNQVSSTDFRIRPTMENPPEALVDLSNEMEDFFRGNYNTDKESFDKLILQIMDDMFDMNSGVVELVPNENKELEQIIPHDGLTFTKKVKDNTLMPEPDSGEPAYFQFEMSNTARNQFGFRDKQGIDLRNIAERAYNFPFRMFKREQKEFSRDRIVWFSEDSRTHDSYGRGRMQKVKLGAEMLLNGDVHRQRFFSDNEFHKGVLQIAEASQQEITNLEKKLDDSKGNEYELPVVGGTEANYIQIDPTPEKMQFLESHKWYTRLFWMAAGLNEMEMGLHENANKGISEEAKANVFRRTTSPLLDNIARTITAQILPFMKQWNQAMAMTGDDVQRPFEFVFDPENRFQKKIEQKIDEKDLEIGAKTVNEIRTKRGKEDYGPVGNLPKQVFDNLASKHPGWTAEQIEEEIEDTPDDNPGGLLGDWYSPDNDNGKGKDKESESGKDDEAPESIANYRGALNRCEEVLEQTKDALRNDRSGEHPPLKSHKDEMSDNIGEILNDRGTNVLYKVEETFPDEESDGHVLTDTDEIVEEFDIKNPLRDEVRESNLDALQTSAEFHASKIESDAEDKFALPDEAKVEISFDILDTFTAEAVRQRALQTAVEVQEATREQIKTIILDAQEKGWSAQKARDKVEEKIDDISKNHAELVARTETLQTSREGSQALAESTDLVQGKEWIATNDNRVRTWHEAMDGTIVRKDDRFTVPQVNDEKQPSSYPRSTRVVGGDQPFNCRCSQAPVIDEEMPDEIARALEEYEGLKVSGLTKRKLEVWKEAREEHDIDADSFEEAWKSVCDEMKVSEVLEEFSMSRSTYYDWKKEFLD